MTGAQQFQKFHAALRAGSCQTRRKDSILPIWVQDPIPGLVDAPDHLTVTQAAVSRPGSQTHPRRIPPPKLSFPSIQQPHHPVRLEIAIADRVQAAVDHPRQQ